MVFSDAALDSETVLDPSVDCASCVLILFLGKEAFCLQRMSRYPECVIAQDGLAT